MKTSAMDLAPATSVRPSANIGFDHVCNARRFRISGAPRLLTNDLMPESLPDKTWEILLGRIKERRCTPFLGAGACYGSLPLGADIARKWAADHGYPFGNPDNLIEVAQYLAIKYDPLFAKELILQQFAGAKSPDFRAPGEPHALLADLPLPIYMTTNYDDFMVKELESRHRDPRRELCRWNESLESEESVFDTDFVPTPANPVVFHLHGHTLPESLVLRRMTILVSSRTSLATRSWAYGNA